MTGRSFPASLLPWLPQAAQLRPAAVRVGGSLDAWAPPRLGGLIDWPEKAKVELDATEVYMQAVNEDFLTSMKGTKERESIKPLYIQWTYLYGDWLKFLGRIQKEGISYLNEGEVKETSISYRRQAEGYQAKLNALRPGSSVIPTPPEPPKTEFPGKLSFGLSGVGVGLGLAAVLALLLASRKG